MGAEEFLGGLGRLGGVHSAQMPEGIRQQPNAPEAIERKTQLVGFEAKSYADVIDGGVTGALREQRTRFGGDNRLLDSNVIVRESRFPGLFLSQCYGGEA